ncbi:MAG: hypothetical protein JWQ75_2480 [Pseudarthrobacter sp.]|nr:hypothetical protein [Pseudarthrobacter sp.]
MSGRGLPIGGSADPVDPRIFQYGAKNRTLRAGTVPLDMHDDPTGISPATTFAREYLKTQPADVGVLIIPAAHGATGFTNAASTYTWTVGAASSPEFDLPGLAVAQTLEGIAVARAAGHEIDLRGVLWHQGENNASLTTAGYSNRLDTLIAFFRSRLAAPKLPVVVGQMGPERVAADPVRLNVDMSHRETPSRVAHTGFAAAMTGGVYPGDIVHFSRVGVEFLGKTFLSGYRDAAAAVVDTGAITAKVPVITGTPQVGSYLFAAPGVWGPAPVTLTYQWYRSGVAISGATGAAYPLLTSDEGKSFTVRVTGSKAGYAAASKTSAGTGAVAKGTLTTPVPTISGTAAVGSTLTAVPGSWGPEPVTLTYKWYRSGSLIGEASAATYTVRTGDAGQTVTVKVTGTKTGYTTASMTSAGTAAVAAGTLAAPVPTITGTPAVGSTLTAVPGSWGPAPVALTYRWYRSGSLIGEASAATYKVRSGDAGQTITVRVTGTKTAYATASTTSAATGVVAKGTLTAPVPGITGTAKVGSTLTAVPGSWGPAPVTLTYRWYRSGALIGEASAATYTVRSGDAGRTVTVKVTGTRAGYATASKTSAGVNVPG